MTDRKPWHGVNLATTLPFRDDLSVDYDAYAELVRFTTQNGVTGIIPNGSLGEYQTLTEEERKRVFLTAVEAAPDAAVIPGVGAYGALESVRFAEHAAENGAPAVMLLPPNAYRASDDEVVDHYRRVAAVGLPILAYNNPIDTKVDLRPDLLARLFAEGLIVSVKEFSGDVRHAYEIRELAPGLDISIGSDDVVFELGLNGAVGWVAGYPNAIPASTVELYTLSTSDDPQDWVRAREIYRDLHPLLRWDSKTWFVQAIKLSQQVAGVLTNTTTRPPRLALPDEVAARIIADTEAVLSKGYR
ncbi:dihydrodipicolinate synthase family protein [Microbacterium arborescens]|uniref:dihydrodipicolinate synthase family protein n=1 Tax=Microbacterium arborescens TaxID=33883 RepID=UPI00277E32EA|nr:dihydrodipicolinate synthase family protein [Microbacterium arborescens]MDQ1217930.1 dihydrodipicolinate synthase/N-acetylneuraminate lyase [Microbacterium arborescens]